MYTDELLQELFDCEKTIIDPPSKEYKEERGHLKKSFTLQSLDGKYSFVGFIRCNVQFNENFSVGLDYNPREEKGTICLLRCNGSHGETKIYPHHSAFHIHMANAETINSGLKPESNIHVTTDYASLDEAIQFYLRKINVTMQDRKNYFPSPDRQITIDFENE
jgi:hypothetical protein